MINVALGGTLHTDIYEVYVQAPKMRTVLPKKTVSIVRGSRLDRILSCNPCRVNALHHQSVDRLGRGLAVVAQDESGIVQAIEGERARFLVGVQWHPELLVWKRPQQRLFAALAKAARESRAAFATEHRPVGSERPCRLNRRPRSQGSRVDGRSTPPRKQRDDTGFSLVTGVRCRWIAARDRGSRSASATAGIRSRPRPPWDCR